VADPGSARSAEEIESFLAAYPPSIVHQVAILRALVARAVPEAYDRLRPGWRLIAYVLPITRQGSYFAYISPEPKHVHLGFAWGTLMSDPEGVLEGAHLRLRRVRYLTFQPGARIPVKPVISLVREAARVCSLSSAERQFISLSLEAGA